jgi:methylthioribulose-1-phosphate dehydratase
MSTAILLNTQEKIDEAVTALVRVGKICYEKNWSLATSSNYSVVVQRDPLLLVMTASGKDKGRLVPSDFVVVDQDGKIKCGAVTQSDVSSAKPSAETLLHLVFARLGAGAVLHTHSVWSTVLSAKFLAYGSMNISGFEMLKAFSGIKTHEASFSIPIYKNTQDIASLAKQVEAKMDSSSRGFLIERHGLYAAGADIDEAMRHIEAYEFLFEVLVRSGG